jgi:hypothetical protein
MLLLIMVKFKLCLDAVELGFKLGSCVLSVGGEIVGVWVDFCKQYFIFFCAFFLQFGVDFVVLI